MPQTASFLKAHNVKLCAKSAGTSGPTPGRTASTEAVVAQEQKTQLAKPFHDSESEKGCQIACGLRDIPKAELEGYLEWLQPIIEELA